MVHKSCKLYILFNLTFQSLGIFWWITLIKILVISACYGHAWALTKILENEGYSTFGIIVGNLETQNEDIENNLFSCQPLDEVIQLIEKINPDLVIITKSLKQRYNGNDIAEKAKAYRYVSLSLGQLVEFPSKETCGFESVDFSELGKKIWLQQLELLMS